MFSSVERYTESFIAKIGKEQLNEINYELKSDKKQIRNEIKKTERKKKACIENYLSNSENPLSENKSYIVRIKSYYKNTLGLLEKLESEREETEKKIKINRGIEEISGKEGPWKYYTNLKKRIEKSLKEFRKDIDKAETEYKNDSVRFVSWLNEINGLSRPDEWYKLGRKGYEKGFDKIGEVCFEKALKSNKVCNDFDLIIDVLGTLAEKKYYAKAYDTFLSNNSLIKKNFRNINEKKKNTIFFLAKAFGNELGRTKEGAELLNYINRNHEKKLTGRENVSCGTKMPAPRASPPNKAKAEDKIPLLSLHAPESADEMQAHDRTNEDKWKEFKYYMNKASESDLRGDKQNALNFCDKAIESYDNNSSAYYRKGMILRRVKSFREALDCFNKAFKVYPLESYRIEAAYTAEMMKER